MEKQKKSLFLISGILFIITCINQLWRISIHSRADFLDALMLLSIGFITVVLFMKRKDKLLGIALGINAITAFIYHLSSLSGYFIRYGNFHLFNFFTEDLFSLSSFLALFLKILIPALLCILIFFEKKLSSVKNTIALVCAYLPVVLIFATVIRNSYYLKEEYYSWHGYVFLGESGYLALFFRFISIAVTAFAFICISSLFTNNIQNEKSDKQNRIGTIGFIALPTGTLLGFLIAFISNLIYGGVQFFDGFFLISILWIIVIALVLAGICLSPLAILYATKPYITNENEVATNYIPTDGYISLSKHIVLCLFTFGFWNWFWTYRTTAFLNRTPNAEQYQPTSALLLCMFVPFYSIYWYYKNGERVDTLSQLKNLNQSNTATMCLILSIFIPIVACILMQDRINNLCSTKVSADKIPAPQQEEKQLENIKRLKELLDADIITQEEFEAKKKQLLGL